MAIKCKEDDVHTDMYYKYYTDIRTTELAYCAAGLWDQLRG